jgi:hypothetical protein
VERPLDICTQQHKNNHQRNLDAHALFEVQPNETLLDAFTRLRRLHNHLKAAGDNLTDKHQLRPRGHRKAGTPTDNTPAVKIPKVHGSLTQWAPSGHVDSNCQTPACIDRWAHYKHPAAWLNMQDITTTRNTAGGLSVEQAT